MAMTDVTLSEALMKQLACPACSEYCTSPIFMCANGHIICHICEVESTECTVCQEPTPFSRNLFAEETGAKITLLCTKGCGNSFSLTDLLLHLPDCESEVMHDCFVTTEDGTSKCTWKGNSKHDLIEHVEEFHPENIFDKSSVKIISKLDFDTSQCNASLLCAHGEIFWVIFHYVSNEATLYPYVYYIGPPSNADNFSFSFVFKLSEMNRKIIFKSRCFSSETWPRVEELAVPLPKDLVERFTTEEDLTCEVKVSPVM